jgi:polysaccharide export outer membrane protein
MLAVLLTVVAAGWAMAQGQTNGSIGTPGIYRLQIEDVIRIQIYNEAQVSQELAVGRDGNTVFPFIGVVRTVGKTTSELEAELAQEYSRRLKIRDPKVSITILRYRSIRASVIGLVGRPGLFDMRPTDTVLTLVSSAGGVAIEGRADLKRATFRRANTNELIPIDLQAMLINGDLSQNYVIQDGDELNVPEEQRNRILILGAVQRSGPIGYRETLTVIDALTSAGGEIPNRTKLSETMVLRERIGNPGEYLRIKVNLVDFIRKGDATQNIRLLPGDIVYFTQTNTPDIDRIANIGNTLFVIDRFFRENFFGTRLIR